MARPFVQVGVAPSAVTRLRVLLSAVVPLVVLAAVALVGTPVAASFAVAAFAHLLVKVRRTLT